MGQGQSKAPTKQSDLRTSFDDNLNLEFRKAMAGEFGSPPNPFGYLAEHRIRCKFHDSLTTKKSGLVKISLVLNGKEIQPCVALTTSADPFAFDAYWCPYPLGGVGEVQLGDAANYMFTPTLTGCYLEIGELLVKHYDGSDRDGRNKVAPNWPPPELETVPAAGPNRTSGRRKWNRSGGQEVDPNNPKDDFDASVVIGVRVGGTWKFYQKSYNRFNNEICISII
jgi:hypothetical protein